MKRLVLLRHGQSTWNKANRFTGWKDVDLTEQGVAEAGEAGRLLREEGLAFDLSFTSLQRRAIRTLWLVLDEMNLMWIPVIRSWKLNERHYGALEGLNKAETAAEYGEEQVRVWRRSYNIRPPQLARDDERYPGNDPRYAALGESELPLGECLKDTVARFMPYWQEHIEAEIRDGKTVLIVAHGNSLRALVKHLDNISDEEIVKRNIPTGMPLVYELDDNLRPIRNYYLGDPEAVKAAMEMVANQGKATAH